MRLFFKAILLLLNLTFLFAQPVLEIDSPNKILKLKFELKESVPVYSISRYDNEVIRPSRLGFTLNKSRALDKNFEVIDSKISEFDQTWTQVWGEKKDIRNNYTELLVNLKQGGDHSRYMNIRFRLYDNGIGFRYEFPEQNNLHYFEIMDELTEFRFTNDHTAWWIPAYHWNRYEYLYSKTALSEIDTVHTPVTFETADGLFLSIHEAALTDFASMALRPVEDLTLQADLVPWSDGIRVKTHTPVKTPWRTIQIADSPGGLITSYLLLNLNEPNKLEDVSWIRPAKYVGIWWELHLDLTTWSSGPRHGATTANARKYIDFAAKYGFDGVLVEGWNIGWESDWVQSGEKFNFTQPYPDFDIIYLSEYARDRGVRLVGHHETGAGILHYEEQMSQAFKYYQRLGINTVKTGYVGHGNLIVRRDENGRLVKGEWHQGQYMVRHYRKVIEEAARHKIMIDAHEPIKDTGIRRTYPNMMTREGARGQEFNAWGPNGGNPPSHTVILPFTRLLAGPMDYTPGIFDLHFKSAKPDNRVNSTLTQQLALYVVFYSPLNMAADLPENYEKRLDAFQFIVDVPVDWEDTRVLNAKIGEYITVVRKDRNSDDWYLGSICGEDSRDLPVRLSFLNKGRKYTAQIYKDGPQADWQTNPYDYIIEETVVDSETEWNIHLASGGGMAVRFIPLKDRQ